MDLALKTGAPVIGLNDSGGARIQEGVLSLGRLRRYFPAQYACRAAWCRRSPPSWGRARAARSTRPRITDFIFMVDETSYMFVTGPDVIKTVTHEDVTKEDAGRRDDAQLDQRRGALSGRTTTPSACA